MTHIPSFISVCFATVLAAAFSPLVAAADAPAPQSVAPHPILFVTQVPIPNDFAAIGSVFANHRATVALSGRGGDLYIRYTDGSLRNLTREAGFGSAVAFQGSNSIAVRDPAVHWSGTRAVFSMVIGAPNAQYGADNFYWQLYEVTGLAQGQTVVMTRVPNQPADFNNLMPTYGSDGSIIYVSDRSRSGERHLYPQLDEYESTPTVTGLWKLEAGASQPRLLEHSPSGSFDPLVDAAGRVLFSRWDHLQRDQQNESAGNTFGTFNYSSEAANAARTTDRSEHFPEPRIAAAGATVSGLRFNHFFPWQINQDGTAPLTLNHLGRHELHSYFTRSLTNDTNLRDFTPAGGNAYRLENVLQMVEDPTQTGRFYAVNAPEFGTLNSGQIIRFTAGLTLNPDQIRLESITHPATGTTTVNANNSGHYRNPLVLSDGSVVVSHATAQGAAINTGTRAAPGSNHMFRLARLVTGSNGFQTGTSPLTGTQGISRRVEYFDPDVRVIYDGPLWELGAVEVRARPVPPSTQASMEGPETAAFQQAGVDLNAFKQYLRQRNLGVLVMRDVTTRDRADKQQPFNLRVAGSGHQNPPTPTGAVYTVGHMQFFQADQIRGITFGGSNPRPGRRPLAVPMHDANATALNGTNPGGPVASVPVAADGSVAAFVPASRALVWQSTDPAGQPVVRERYWVSVQPGEVRACDGCHGVNTASQSGQGASTQVSAAFVQLLNRWRAENADLLFSDDFE
ncbi:hypothetical protein [Aquimonas sp.]|jgi:hypothetical protein|uniref:HzsA-related protein n=1 Tax=Aquimonas sp. TaxID=1872588 RepID=UPI0037BEBC62